jgi:Concanavalin A-like lectin/glucanases superfamily
VLAALLLAAACAYVLLEPWHGPTVLALSEQHGIDAGDLPALPLIALALALSRSWDGGARPRWWAGGRTAAVAALALGVLLLAGLLDPRIGSPLVPAGGGTFNRTTEQVSGRRAEPVGRWSHLAVTYDGARIRMYVNGVEAASRPASGPIRGTTDPLWIGGNRPYGEYFRGVIDELRVYDRALSPGEVRAAMTTPIRAHARAPGLVAAYGFDDVKGRNVRDASGSGNAGTIQGARWTASGRFGGGIRFDGSGEVVRVPASPALNLTRDMTLAGWIKPSESQSGWRTVLARQTDAYTLMAGGGRNDVSRLNTLDRARFVLVILLAVWTASLLAAGHAAWATGRGGWYWPVALFMLGSLVDVTFAHLDALTGPALVAAWLGATSGRGAERVCLYALAVVFAAVTILAIGDPGALPLPRDADGPVRSAALGLLLATVAGLSLRRSPEPSWG